MKQRIFTIAAGLITLVAAVIWVVQGFSLQDPGPVNTVIPSGGPTSVAAPSPSTDPAPPERSSQQERRLFSYAIATTDLHGLAPDVAPGTRLDLWVATQPPVTETPDVLPLVQGAILAEIVPPTLPDGPFAAVLKVPLRHARTLIWGHRFGALSVLEVPTPLP